MKLRGLTTQLRTVNYLTVEIYMELVLTLANSARETQQQGGIIFRPLPAKT